MGFMVQQVGSIPAISHNIKIGKNMLKEEFEELIKREVNENQYKNIETAYEALPEYMDKMYLASAISNDIIWKKVYEMIDRLEDGEYICVALRNVVFMYFKTHKNIYEFRSDEMVRIYFPELEEKISMATEPEETRTFYGWFGCLSPETKEVRLNIVKDIIKELE